MTARLVSIIGPPAAGKTTLADVLAERLGAKVIYEDYAGNPFLASAYMGTADIHLPAQLYYLMSRVKQLNIAAWPDSGIFITDYGFCQDRMYAAENLTDDELKLYDRVARRLKGLVKQPDIVIHVDATENTLAERIANRGRDFEKSFSDEFLAHMRSGYNDIDQELTCKVIYVDSDKIDIRTPAAIDELISKVREFIK